MKNIFTADGKEIDDDPRFTGPVIQKTIVDEESKEQIMYYVVFKNGARTFVHYHPSDQILIGCEGEGIAVFLDKISEEGGCSAKYKQKGDVIVIREGDTVFVPAGTSHYHGSNNKEKTFAHIAIRAKTGPTTWDENCSFPLE